MSSNFTSVSDAPVVKMAESYSDPVQRFRALAAIYNTDHDPKVRKQAWSEIQGFSRNPDTLKVVIELCVNYPDADIRNVASKVVDELPNSRDVVQFLIKLSESDPDQNVCKFAREKVAKLAVNSAIHNSREAPPHFQTHSAPVAQPAPVYSPRRVFHRGETLNLTPSTVPLRSMDRPATIIYKKAHPIWKKRMLILVIGLLLIGVVLWAVIGDPMALVFMVVCDTTPSFILAYLLLVAWNERSQINRVFNHPRWAELQLPNNRVWFGRAGIYDDKKGYNSLDDLKNVSFEGSLSFECGSKGSYRGQPYDTRRWLNYPVSEERRDEALELVDRYKRNHHLGAWWKKLFG